MTRVFGNFVLLEMALLWLLEFVLSLCVLYLLLLPGALPATLAGNEADYGLYGLHIETLNHAVLLALTISVTSFSIGLYRPEICFETRRLLQSTVVGGLLAFPAIILVGAVARIDLGLLLGRDGAWPLKLLLAWVLLLFVTRLAFRSALRLGLLARRMVVVGPAPETSGTVAAIGKLREGFFSITAVLPSGDRLDLNELRRSRVWGVVVSHGAQGADADRLLQVRRAGIQVFDDTEFREQQLRRLDIDLLSDDWLSSADGLVCGRLAASIRRLAEIVISLVLLAATLPLVLLAALLIKIESRGPVLFRQERLGLDGRPFTLFKLRSMRQDAEAAGPAWASERDPRVTRVGAVHPPGAHRRAAATDQRAARRDEFRRARARAPALRRASLPR